MAPFDKLAEAFEENKDNAGTAGPNDPDALKKSLAIINAVDKLKKQGVKLVAKANLDYLLALRFVETASKRAGRDLLAEYLERQEMLAGSPGPAPEVPPRSSPPLPPSPSSPSSSPAPGAPEARRSPRDNPEAFQKALESSRQVVAQVEEMNRQGKAVPIKLMETYSLCQKFLRKYS